MDSPSADPPVLFEHRPSSPPIVQYHLPPVLLSSPTARPAPAKPRPPAGAKGPKPAAKSATRSKASPKKAKPKSSPKKAKPKKGKVKARRR